MDHMTLDYILDRKKKKTEGWGERKEIFWVWYGGYIKDIWGQGIWFEQDLQIRR